MWKFSPPVPVLVRPPKPVRAAVVDASLDVLRSALAAIPNDDTHSLDYDSWRNVLFAIHHATEGSDEGLTLAHEFSARSPKYDPEFLDNRFWPYAGVTSGEVITERTLYSIAGQHGWRDPTIIDDFEVIDEGEKPPEKQRFTPIPAHEFAVAVRTHWIVKGILPAAELAVLYGESGSGKSFMALDLAAAIAQGTPWRGHRVRQGSVVYLAAEGANGFRGRLRAYANHHSVNLADLDIHVIHAAPNMLNKTDALDVARGILTVVGRPQVIFVDTLAQTMPGGNENAGEDMGTILAHCRGLHVATGALVTLVHHSGKDASRGARGWSGLRAAADVEMEVVRDEHDRVLSITKQKDGDDGGDFGFQLQVVVIGQDEDGDDITSCVVVETHASSRQMRKAIKGANQKLAMHLLTDLTELTGEPIEREVLIGVMVDQLPYDAAEGKRDRRREIAVRAVEALREAGAIVANGVYLEKGSL